VTNRFLAGTYLYLVYR